MNPSRLIAGNSGLVLVACLGLTVFAIAQIVDLKTGAVRLGMDPSYSRLLPASDPERVFHEEVRALFGGDDVLLFALRSERGIFHPETLDQLRVMTETLEEDERVERVISLANAQDIRSDGANLRVAKFLDEEDSSAAALTLLRDRVAANPIWSGLLVSDDGSMAILIVELLPISEREITEGRVDLELLERLRSVSPEGQILLTGAAHVRSTWSRLLDSDLARVIPLLVLCMAVVALLAFRSLAGTLVPVITIFIALIWALGAIAAAGLDLNAITVVILPLILIVGFSYAIHVVSAAVESAGDSRERVGAALREVTLPVILTGVTTAAGFLSLLASPLAAIREFGLYCSLGVGTSVLASLTFAPALSALLLRARDGSAAADSRIDAWFSRLADFDMRHRLAILLATAAVAVTAFIGTLRIDVSTGLVSNLPADNDTRLSFEAIDRDLRGGSLMSVVIEADEDEAFLQPENLRAVEALQYWLADQPEVRGSTSLADFVKVLHRGLQGDHPDHLVIPDSRQFVAQLLLLGPSEDIEEYADTDYRIAHILVRSSASDSAAIGDLTRRIRSRLETLPAGLDGRVTGNAVLFAHSLDLVATGQATSMALAFVLIFGILSVLFTSVRMGFIALIPNALPILVYYGALGITGTSLNLTTGVVACLVLGIAVDDTIHFMVQFNAGARRSASESQGVHDALKAVGRPVTITSAALCIGFLGVTTAELRSIMEFGALASFTLAFAWLVDITFTPALASRLRVVTIWELLTLDLGSEPQKTIPLFRGLSRRQARIAALMMRIRSFEAGDMIMRRGEPGDDLYVILDGEVQASVPGDEGRFELRKLGRGEVLGEIGLHRGERSADVEATSAGRAICLSNSDLAQLRSRRPRIAARVNENLIHVMADRVIDLTARLSGAVQPGGSRA